MTRLVRDDGETLEVLRNVWECAQVLAAGESWEPEGTKPPEMPRDVGILRGRGGREERYFQSWEKRIEGWEEDHWRGGYDTNVGALVTGPDSRAFGEKLLAAFENVPDRVPVDPETGLPRPTAPGKFVGSLKAEQRGEFATAAEQMAGPALKSRLRELIAWLLKRQAFRIR